MHLENGNKENWFQLSDFPVQLTTSQTAEERLLEILLDQFTVFYNILLRPELLFDMPFLFLFVIWAYWNLVSIKPKYHLLKLCSFREK